MFQTFIAQTHQPFKIQLRLLTSYTHYHKGTSINLILRVFTSATRHSAVVQVEKVTFVVVMKYKDIFTFSANGIIS